MSESSVWAHLDLCLAVETDDGRAARLRDELRAGRLDWMGVVARANADYLAPAIWTTLSRLKLLDDVPDDLRTYLTLLHRENAARNRLIRKQCCAAGRVLSAGGVQAALLKGAAWLFDGSLAADDRMMRDVDLLVPADQMAQAVELLTARGYTDTSDRSVESGHFHHAPLLPDDGLVAVELHRDLAHRPGLVPPEEVLAGATAIAPGLLLPRPAARILHSVVHGQIEDGGFWAAATASRDLLDLARLVIDHGAEVDWPALARTARERGMFGVLSGSLHVAHATLGSPLPAPFDRDVRGRLQAWRRLQQRRSSATLRVSTWAAKAARALAWDRDAYGLGQLRRGSFAAHVQVNRRRLTRLGAALRRSAPLSEQPGGDR